MDLKLSIYDKSYGWGVLALLYRVRSTGTENTAHALPSTGYGVLTSITRFEPARDSET